MNFLREYKKDKSCVICGWNEHPDILQFHHRDPKTKELKLSKGSVGNYGKDKIIEEVNKCDLLCPNCHYWLHFQNNAILE